MNDIFQLCAIIVLSLCAFMLFVWMGTLNDDLQDLEYRLDQFEKKEPKA